MDRAEQTGRPRDLERLAGARSVCLDAYAVDDAGDMNFELMADRTRYLKEDPRGVSEMCRVIEDVRRESLIGVALRMLKAGKYALDEIAGISGLPLEEIKKLQSQTDP